MYLTFGKYRNHSVKEVVEKDKQYSLWLMTQRWFTIKHKDLYKWRFGKSVSILQTNFQTAEMIKYMNNT